MINGGSAEAPGLGVIEVVGLISGQHPCKSVSSFQAHAPPAISEWDLLVLLDLRSQLIAVILLIVVGGEQQQVFKLDFGEVGCDCPCAIGGVFDCENGKVAFGVVVEVLARALVEVCPSACLQVDAFQTFPDQIGHLLCVDSFKIDSFATVKSEVVGVFSVLPVGTHKYSVISCRKRHL